MRASKPNQIMAGASMHGVKRARDGATGRSMAMDAALGLDNFARLLQNNPMGTQDFAMQQQQHAAQMSAGQILGQPAQEQPTPLRSANNQIMRDAGLTGAQPLNRSPEMLNQLRNMNQEEKLALAQGQSMHVVPAFRNIAASRVQGSDAAVLALRTAAHKAKEAVNSVTEAVNSGIGKLSSLFESGRDGVAAIGYDRVGGTSYGTYQIASNTGTMDEFLTFLDAKAPDYAKELRAAGPANTGSRQGDMPEAWRGIAARDPEGFGALQHEFIEQKHYQTAARKLGEQGIAEDKLSPVLREVLFSTAVQHGPAGAARIISRAVGQDTEALMRPMPGTNQKRTEEMVIKRIYGIRQEQFSSSTPQVQEAVSNRLSSEMNLALNMLKSGSQG